MLIGPTLTATVETHVDSVGLQMAFGASPYSYAAGEWMFEHREAVPTPLGGGTIAYSLIRPAHLAP